MARAVTLTLVGSGGDGVILLGELLAATAANAGLHCFMTKSFGPQIRGGETSCTLTIADQPLHCPAEQADLLGVLDWDALAHFGSELRWRDDAIVLWDDKQADPPTPRGGSLAIQALPLEHLAMQYAGTKLARNMVLGGAICTALGWPPSALSDLVKLRMSKRGAEELRRNLAAIEASHALPVPLRDAPELPTRGMPLLLETGNQAIVRGAIAAGCRYFAGYPISPATEILEQIIAELPQHGGTAVQAEDEIAAIGMALGAAAGGIKAMTATSGPGFSLMAETLGLAVVTELPLVVVDVQRVGPSTGIPSRTEQADLNMALYGRHGDAPLPVLAPTSIADCGAVANWAFNVAHFHQTPVVVLSDQFLAQGVQTIESIGPVSNPPASPMKRPNGSLTGLVHFDSGEPSGDPAVHAAALDKRTSGLGKLRTRSIWPEQYPLGAQPRGKVGLLTWGSSYGPCCVAADMLTGAGILADVYAPRQLYPLDSTQLKAWLDHLDRVVVVELNHSGQFYRYLRGEMDFGQCAVHAYHRAGGMPLTPSEIVAAIEPLLAQ